MEAEDERTEMPLGELRGRGQVKGEAKEARAAAPREAASGPSSDCSLPLLASPGTSSSFSWGPGLTPRFHGAPALPACLSVSLTWEGENLRAESSVDSGRWATRAKQNTRPFAYLIYSSK